MSRSITVGLDGTPQSLAAADWAAREAGRRGLPVRLLHVCEHQPGAWPLATYVEERTPWSGERLAEAASGLQHRHPGLTVTAEQITGDPAAELSALASHASDTELLALGSQGLGSLAGFLLGSISLSTLSRASRPVVVVRASEGDATEAGDVLLGLDLQHPSDALIGFAWEAAERRAATLRVVHGWTPPPLPGYGPDDLTSEIADSLGTEHAHKLADTLRPWRAKRPDLRVDEQAPLGRPASSLIHAAATASLLVVGRRTRRAPVGPRIGAVTHAVLHHSPVPVAVVPHD